MSMSPDEKILLRISKAQRTILANYKEGVYLSGTTGREIDELHQQASADRLQLASGFLDTGNRLFRGRPPMYRVAVGRYYYAIYHTMRAVVYYDIEGDDHEKHSELPHWVPKDFPNVDYWKNALKDARLRRNEADYDPYPLKDNEFRDAAKNLKERAENLYGMAQRYLTQKGCSLA